MENHAGKTHYAVLVGINAYEENPLKYCVPDVHRIKEYLEAGLSRVDIRIFTAPEAASHQTQNSTPRPTYQRVVAALEDVTRHANPGSFVYLHFSGHGVRMATEETFLDRPAGDLALQLLEDDNSDKSIYLRGSTLAVILEAMLNKGLVVTMVLDCCFSAAVYRHPDPSVRSLPYDAEIDLNSPRSATKPVAEFQDYLTASVLGSRDVSLKPNWRIKTDGYAIIAACGPHELAKEFISDDGQGHGALSYFLLRALDECGGPARQHKYIYDNLRARFRQSWPYQNPVFYGNKNQGFFGHPGLDDVTGTTFPLLQKLDGSWEILAGQAHGILVGDQFLVEVSNSALPDDNRSEATSSLTVSVLHTTAFTSTLQAVDISRSTNDRIHGAAKALTLLALQKYTIRLLDGLPQRDQWPAALQRRSLALSLASDDDEEEEEKISSQLGAPHNDRPRFYFQIALTSDGEYEIWDQGSQRVPNLPIMTQDGTDVDEVCDFVEHLAKFELVRDLVNIAPTDAFLQSFVAEMTDYWGNVYLPGFTIKVEHDRDMERVLELIVQNKCDEDLYVYVYNLGPQWQVENILRGSYEVIPPRQTAQGFTGVFRKKLKALVPPGLSAGGQVESNDIRLVGIAKNQHCSQEKGRERDQTKQQVAFVRGLGGIEFPDSHSSKF
ncbi:hypothetical protein Z517_07172 [Fonsecaea pedrosoi CBS 271.37]|uniref:Peptidase C14 caspase domain-containing protein n=1 Tax=Fonsecaea pedrosoi CBS 271.37 TaxID=1442368 RepID=A0A0D2DRP3_9EURO|nr:uncharacterized protein Z517_07172 [Fonsecaea pedrosoi CBS 271.37]KIW80556.1 hypothetical protein Z517_07172 [Fonsecaea pedrosoi CBS 271.37]